MCIYKITCKIKIILDESSEEKYSGGKDLLANLLNMTFGAMRLRNNEAAEPLPTESG